MSSAGITYRDALTRGWNVDRTSRRNATMPNAHRCPICQRTIAARADGSLAKHAPQLGIGKAAPCAGSGVLP